MQFVDKSYNRDSFNEYTRDYLHKSQVAGGTGFIPKLADKTAYENFSNPVWKYQKISPQNPYDGWLSILMNDSDNRCCYCMCRLSETKDISVEHLIPESIPKADEADEFAFYAKHAPYLRDNVITGRSFDNLAEQGVLDIDQDPHMPHLIAHGNLFLACNNKIGCSCNNHRHNSRILPLMLMPDVNTWTEYDSDGNFMLSHPSVDDSRTTLGYLNLNDPTLIRIRRLWYLFSRKGICPSANRTYTTDEIDSMLRSALDIQDETSVIPDEFIQFITEDHYWTRLLKYDWFYTYYLDKYPVI